MHSGPELLRLLRRHGFEVVSAKGSHLKLRHEDGRLVILPCRNTQYPAKTYHAILRNAGLRLSGAKRR